METFSDHGIYLNYLYRWFDLDALDDPKDTKEEVWAELKIEVKEEYHA